jgi:uncharacterized membrane protein
MEGFIIGSFIIAGIAAVFTAYVYFTTDKEKKTYLNKILSIPAPIQSQKIHHCGE